MRQPSFRTILLPVLTAALAAGGAGAATVAYNTGDLLVGFRDSSGSVTRSVVVNLGSAAGFRDDTLGFTNTHPVTVALGDLATDLVATFGSNWYTNTNIKWGIVGSPSNAADVNGDSATTVYASKAESIPGHVTTAWSLSDTSRGIASSLMVGLQASTNGFNTYTASDNNSRIAVENNSDSASWASYQKGGANSNATTAFKVFNPGIEGSLAKPLDLFRMQNAGTGGYIATFSIGSNGSISVIPEPTAPLLGLIGTTLAAVRRRRP